MFNLTIARKLVLGFGLTLAMLIGLAVVGYSSNLKSAKSMRVVGGMIADTAVGEGATVDMLMLRMKVKDFLIRNEPEDIAGYNTWRGEFVEAIQKSRTSFQDPGRLERLTKIEELFATYDQTFSQVQTIISERNRLRREVLDVVGKKAADAVKVAGYRMLDADDESAERQVMSGLLDILEGRLYVIKFLSSSSPAAYERASGELNSAHDNLAQALPDVQDEESKTLISAAVADLETYIATLVKVRDLVDNRNQWVKGTLDQIGPQIADLQLDIQHSLIDDSVASEVEAEHVISTANRAILAVSVAATFLGAFAGYLIYLGTVRPLKAVIDRVGEIADGDGDLTQRVDDQRHDELGELGSKVNAFISRTHDTIYAVREATGAVTAAASDIRGNAEDMATNMDQQNDRVAQISHAIEEMNNAVSDVARQAAHASTTSNQAGDAAKNGGEIVDQTIQGMNTISDAVNASARSVTELGQRSDQIGEIVAVINEIAEQTNLLALNAAIEAARAGEHGRGFAVVADEVRKLADRTTVATQEIGESIRAIQGGTSDAVGRMTVGAAQVGEGVGLAEQAGASLKAIVDSTGDVAGMIHAIASATEEQSATTVQISQTVDATSSAIREASGGAKQSFEAAAQLTLRAAELQDLIGRFKLAETADNRR